MFDIGSHREYGYFPNFVLYARSYLTAHYIIT